jgi:hypothetical protein
MQALLDNVTLKLGEKNPQIFHELEVRLSVAGNFILFSPFLWLKIAEVGIVDLVGTLVMQVVLAGILIAIFTRRLNRLGESMMRVAMRTSGT